LQFDFFLDQKASQDSLKKTKNRLREYNLFSLLSVVQLAIPRVAAGFVLTIFR